MSFIGGVMSKVRWIGIGLFGMAQTLALNAQAQGAAPSISSLLGSVNTLLLQIPAVGATTLGHMSLDTFGLQVVPVISSLQIADGIAVVQSITAFGKPINGMFTPDLAGLSGLTKFSP
jgi:hypothetical protein